MTPPRREVMIVKRIGLVVATNRRWEYRYQYRYTNGIFNEKLCHAVVVVAAVVVGRT